jgi:hypothetical protein
MSETARHSMIEDIFNTFIQLAFIYKIYKTAKSIIKEQMSPF